MKNRKSKKKTYIALFVIFVLMLGLFGACKKAGKGIIVTDSEGKTRVLATNEKGETMTDEANNIVILVTGLDGKEETQRVAMPDYYVSGSTIETKTYTVKVPKGWEQGNGISDITLVHKSTNAEINLFKMDGKTLEYANIEAELLMNAMRKEGDTVETTQVTIYGVEGTKYTATRAEESKTTATSFYIFEKNESVYSFYTIVDDKDKDRVDFEAIINAIVFK